VHIDRVYIPKLQPRVAVERVALLIDGREHELIRDGRWTLEL